MGFLYAITVVAGIHHMYTTIDLGQLSAFGYTYWLPLASAANVAQGAASLAVGIKSKDKKIKSLALPSSLSAFMGITEPAIFGVNLRFFKPFICACVGGGVGAMFASIVGLGATGTGVTGIFGILLHLHSPINYLLTMLIAAGVSFVLTWLFGYKEAKAVAGDSGAAAQVGDDSRHNDHKAEAVMGGDNVHGAGAIAGGSGKAVGESGGDMASVADHVYAPIKGRVIPMEEVPDETFAACVLGQGAAIVPDEGKVYAPFDGEISLVFDTKHAIALTSKSGIEVLIHIGINTVELNGQFFTVHVQDGDKVTRGQLLAEFDMDEIAGAGYNLTTPVIINNTDDYAAVERVTAGPAGVGDLLLSLKK